MRQFLPFPDEGSARRRNRELMNTNRKPGNPDGDRKPYGTSERYVVRVAKDGQALLEVGSIVHLTAIERNALMDRRPVKFDPVEDGAI